MDNASSDMFDAAQMTWFKKVLANDAKNASVRTVVLGMHAALPDSSSAGHSMNDSAQEQQTGRKVYAQLSAFRKTTRKNVYVLASHSHFVMNNVYNTACHKDDVLPGWIMGSAGAVRYRLPPTSGCCHASRRPTSMDTCWQRLPPDGSIPSSSRRLRKPTYRPAW